VLLISFVGISGSPSPSLVRWNPKYGHEEKAAALPEPDHTIYNYNGYGDVTSKTVGPGNRGGGASCQRGGGQCSCSQCIGGRCETCVVNGNTGEAYRFRPKENQYRYGHDGALDLSSMTAPDQVLAEVLAYPENKHVKHAGVFHVMQVVSKASDTDHTIYNYNDYGQVTSKTVGPGNRGGGSGCQRGGGQCSCSQCIGGRCETCVVNGYTGEAIRFRPKENQYRYGHEEKAAALPEPDHTTDEAAVPSTVVASSHSNGVVFFAVAGVGAAIGVALLVSGVRQMKGNKVHLAEPLTKGQSADYAAI